MEIIPYLLSVLACLLVFRWNWANTRRKSGEPVGGLFRYPGAAPSTSTSTPTPSAEAARRPRHGARRQMR